MKYHEIGERFEYKGNVLEVVKRDNCNDCFFRGRVECGVMSPMRCSSDVRNDDTSIIYRLVEKCKTKNMEQKTEIKMEEVNKETIELIKKDAEKYETPPIGVKTIPKRHLYYKEILDKLFETYKAKDKDYGSAFSEMFDELGIDYAYGKLREKINRIKVLRKQPNMVESEGLEDALLDTAGYAILTLVELKKRKGNGKSE